MPTAVADQASKIDLIEHLNQDHTDEILLIAQVYTEGQCPDSAYLVDLFEEGAQVTAQFDNQSEKSLYIPFQIQGDMEEKLLYLAYAAMAKQGLPLSDKRRQFFTVQDSHMLTPNLLRLTIASDVPLPENAPAYAYGFLLKVLQQQPQRARKSSSPHCHEESADSAGRKSRWQHVVDLALLWLMKTLSPKQRQKMIHSMNKGIRYYTLQSAWKSTAERAFCDRGFVDVFLHGETAGSQWARSLAVGDIVTTRVEHADKHENLHRGQALLLADETAYPALLALLQQWQNPLAPYVIIVSEQPEEQAYFKDDDLRGVAKVQRIVCAPNEQSQHLLKAIAALPTFTTAWGACEKEAAKAVRMHLRTHCHIKGYDNRIKAYWALETREK